MRNYVFGGETGLTHEQLQGRRRVADQMLAANNRMPQNVGEGLHSIGRAIAGTILTKRNERREAELQDEANAQFNAVFGGGDFGAGGVASTGAPMSGFNPDAATPTSFTPSPTSGATPGFTDLINASLSRTESGGDHTARNAEGYTGEFQWGDARLADFNRANGTNFTLDQLHQDPALQQRAQDWHVNDIMTRAEGDGLMAFVGEDLNGPDVPGGVVTPGGIVAAAHLGGYGGMSRFIRSRGQHNPADSNGTSLMDYLDTHAMGGGASAQQPAPEPQQGRQASVAAIARAMGNPMIQQNPGRMAVLQALLGNALEGPETMSPYQQAQLALAQSQETRAQAEFDQRMNATPERERIQDANGRWRYTDDSSLVFPDVEVQPEPGFRMLSADEVAQDPRLDPATPYQVGPDGRVSVISGGGTNVTVTTGAESGQWGEPPTDHVWLRGEDGAVITEPDPSGRGQRPVSVPISGGPEDTSGDNAAIRSSAADSIALVDAVLNDPNLDAVTGMIQGRLPARNQQQQDLLIRIEQLQGQAFLQAFETLKGGGQITEREGQAAQAAIARLQRVQSGPAYRAALTELREIMARGLERAGGALPARAEQPQPAAEPMTGTRRRYNPQTDEFEEVR